MTRGQLRARHRLRGPADLPLLVPRDGGARTPLAAARNPDAFRLSSAAPRLPPRLSPSAASVAAALAAAAVAAALAAAALASTPITATAVFAATLPIACVAAPSVSTCSPSSPSQMPYFSYISLLHLYESLGWWRRSAEVKRVHFAEAKAAVGNGRPPCPRTAAPLPPLDHRKAPGRSDAPRLAAAAAWRPGAASAARLGSLPRRRSSAFDHQEWNEFHHLMIMESLGGDQFWRDRFFAHHAAIAYYWILVLLWLASPTSAASASPCRRPAAAPILASTAGDEPVVCAPAPLLRLTGSGLPASRHSLAYNFSELIESHAVDTYGEFVDANAEALRRLPAPRIARLYYESADSTPLPPPPARTRAAPRRFVRVLLTAMLAGARPGQCTCTTPFRRRGGRASGGPRPRRCTTSSQRSVTTRRSVRRPRALEPPGTGRRACNEVCCSHARAPWRGRRGHHAPVPGPARAARARDGRGRRGGRGGGGGRRAARPRCGGHGRGGRG